MFRRIYGRIPWIYGGSVWDKAQQRELRDHVYRICRGGLCGADDHEHGVWKDRELCPGILDCDRIGSCGTDLVLSLPENAEVAAIGGCFESEDDGRSVDGDAKKETSDWD